MGNPVNGFYRRVVQSSTILSLAFALLSMLPALKVQAQLEQGSLTGTIKDPSGAVVPGVPITLTNAATGVAQNAVSTSTGTYSFTAVNAGTYTLKATANGFEAYVADNVQIHVQQAANIDIKLSIG